MEPSNSARGRAAATFHALALRATRPKLSFRRVSVVLLVLVGCTSMGLTGLAAAAGRTSDGPPPVPECFYTGHDGYSDPTGPCGGMLIPGGGTVLVFTHPDKDGIFKLTGPAPLQTKHWVACGDAGCVYNELSWAIYAGRVSGCAVNTATCDVRFAKGWGGAGWNVVYVRQNTEPKILYALWNGEPGGTISGYVLDEDQQGVPGATVSASGASGGGSSPVDAPTGFYAINVKAGHYRVAPSGGPSGIKPPKFEPKSLNLYVAVGGAARADFTLQAGQKMTLSGKVQASDCSSTTCRLVGIPGVTVDVTGTEEAGNPVSTSVTTASDGGWKAKVPPGSYTVTPQGAGFDPESLPASGKGPVSGLDFTTCEAVPEGSPAGPRSRDVLAAISTGACPNGIDWQMPPRVAKGRSFVGDGLPLADYVYPKTWSAQLYLTRNDARVTTCQSGYVWKWRVTPLDTDGNGTATITQPKDGCSPSFETSQLGTYRVTAARYKQTRKGLVATRLTVESSEVELDDYLIVGLGDSNGSGEGDPPFDFDQCHRGVASYQYQAAQRLEDQFDGHASITFVADACSGAKIQDLSSVSFAGIDPTQGPPLKPQILALKALIADSGTQPRRKVDAAFVSIGINNIAFGPLMGYCVLNTNIAGPCQDQKVTPVYGSDGSVAGFTHAPLNFNALTLGQWVASLTAHLPGEYQAVQSALASMVAPKDTFITEYPTFAYSDTEGDVCGYSLTLHGSTWNWLKTSGMALNAQVDATSRLGWHVVRVNPGYFLGHGYCASDSWFVPLTRAVLINNSKAGAFHATATGALVTAKLVALAACPALAGTEDCKGLTKPSIP